MILYVVVINFMISPRDINLILSTIATMRISVKIFDGLYAAFNRLRYGRNQAPRFEHAGQGGGDSA